MSQVQYYRLNFLNVLNMKTSLIFILGVGMGVVLGLLVAPESGRITRSKIRAEADRMIDKALAKKQLKELVEEGVVTTTAVAPEERYTLS
jgi:gas vesicle protein